MKQQSFFSQATAMLATILAAGSFVTAQTFDWSGASGTDLNWSTPGNWTPGGPPGATDAARFFDAGVTNDVFSINNIVSADTTVQSLWVGPTGGSSSLGVTAAHNTLIPSGVTLTLSGTDSFSETSENETYYVGTRGYVAVDTTVTNTISGGGTLNIDNPNNILAVRQGFQDSGSHQATLDMSGLDNFIADLQDIRVGVGTSSGTILSRRSVGFLHLAKTNMITVRGTAGDPGILVGDNQGNNNGNSSFSTMLLGQENTIYADVIRIAGQKQDGRLLFNSLFFAPSLTLRGSDGTGRASEIDIGDNNEQTNTSNPTDGVVDLGDGTVDVMVDTVIMGRGHRGANNGGGSGILGLGAGTFDANTIEVGYQAAANVTATSAGTINVTNNGLFASAATLNVNEFLRLGRSAGAPGPINSTLNIDGGTVNVAGDIAEDDDSTSTIQFSSGLVDMQPAGDPTPGNITADTISIGNMFVGTPAIITNAASINSSMMLTVGSDAVIAGTPDISIGTNGAFDVSALIGGYSMGGTFGGGGYVSGDFTQLAGGTISPGIGPGTLQFFNNLTLNGGTLVFDLADPNQIGGVNDLISVFGSLALAGTNEVEIVASSGSLPNGTYQLFNSFFSLTGDSGFFEVAGTIAQSRHTFTFDTSTATQIDLIVGGDDPASLLWVGGGANIWDVQGAANWNNGGSADQFFSLDNVTFDDSGANTPAIDLGGSLAPGSITVNNTTDDYTFSGSGGISGSPALNKLGSASLTIANNADNSFGAITVDGGTVSVAGGGMTTFDGDLTLNVGTLALDLNADTQLANSISGVAGTLVKQDTNTLTLSGDNSTFDGGVTVNAGTLRAGSTTALGSIAGGTVIADGATLDVNDLNLGLEQVTVSGQGVGGLGAIVENTGSGAFTGPNLAYVTLAGHTTFGGTGRWDLRSDPTSTTNAALSTGGNAYDLTKVGANQVTLVGVAVDPALADIDVQAGTFAVETVTSSLGNPADTLTVQPGATLQFFNSSVPYDKVFVLNGTGTNTTVNVPSGADNTLTGPVTLNGDVIIAHGGSDDNLTIIGTISGSGSLAKTGGSTLALTALNNSWLGGLVIEGGTLQVGDGGANGSLPATAITNNGTLAFNSTSDLTVANEVSGTGSVTKNGEGKVTMTGNHSYSGSTTVSGGTLQVDGSLLGGGGVTVTDGTLAGEGTIVGTVDVQAGGTVAPGASISTLNIVGALTLAGTNVMELNKTGGTLTSDRISGISSLTLGGVLSLDITGDPLATGDEFQLYSATIILPGGFASIEPAEPGPGLTWDTSDLSTGGVLRVAGDTPSEPVITGVELLGANFILSGTSGIPNADYHVLTSTNAAEPLANWSALQTNSFDGSGNFSFTNAVDPNTPQRFFLLQVP